MFLTYLGDLIGKASCKLQIKNMIYLAQQFDNFDKIIQKKE
jgi:hypothetical protein